MSDSHQAGDLNLNKLTCSKDSHDDFAIDVLASEKPLATSGAGSDDESRLQ